MISTRVHALVSTKIGEGNASTRTSSQEAKTFSRGLRTELVTHREGSPTFEGSESRVAKLLQFLAMWYPQNKKSNRKKVCLLRTRGRQFENTFGSYATLQKSTASPEDRYPEVQ